MKSLVFSWEMKLYTNAKKRLMYYVIIDDILDNWKQLLEVIWLNGDAHVIAVIHEVLWKIIIFQSQLSN